MKKNYILICFLLLTQLIFAQKISDCSNSLVSANKEYEIGNFEKSVVILENCLSSMDQDERNEAYRLLALNYLGLNKDKESRKSLVSLLKAKPDYKDFPYVDPIEFSRLLDEYDVWPTVEFGLLTGVNFNTVIPLKNYSITNSPATFNPRTGYQFGFSTEYFFKKNLTLTGGLLYEGLSYSRIANNVSGWEQEFSEDLNYYSIPLTVRYYFSLKNKIKLGAEAGWQMQFIDASNSFIFLDNMSTGEHVQNTGNMSISRSKYLNYVLLGLISKYKLGAGYFSFGVRLALGINNIVDVEKRYQNLPFIIKNQYVDSDISFMPLYFTLGYQLPFKPFYSVKKVR